MRTRQPRTRPSRARSSGALSSRTRALRATRFGVTASLVLVVLCATLVLAAAAPAAQADPTSVTCQLSAAGVQYGAVVTVSGQLTPGAAQAVTITLGAAVVATATSDAAGAYSADFVAHAGGDVIAVSGATQSAPVRLDVQPVLDVSHGAVAPFLKTRYVLAITPSGYAGEVGLSVRHRGAVVATLLARAHDGKATFDVPLSGIDAFDLAFSAAADGLLSARSLQTRVQVKWSRVAVGSHGPMVKGLLTALARLKVRVPGIGSSFSGQDGDALVAFQKAYGLSRSRVADHAVWRKLDGARLIRPRYKSPRVHVEVNKARQILMVVRNGVVYGYIPVSTGATGNTPEGSFSIRQKSPATSTFFGPATLTWVMGFIGNFAIHGYPEVPSYPASHGCIREPLWAANWTYSQSFVGERLYVYH
ncbi:MAG TPA: L,D-transpeptidase [Thermoleophilia bacterium]|nr:L,D-transpeptidase [Thermoleophilia bacterium]